VSVACGRERRVRRGRVPRPHLGSADLRRAVGLSTSPDGAVICGSLEQHGPSPDATAQNPAVRLEVMSDSSEEYDTGAKLEMYRTFPLRCASASSSRIASAASLFTTVPSITAAVAARGPRASRPAAAGASSSPLRPRSPGTRSIVGVHRLSRCRASRGRGPIRSGGKGWLDRQRMQPSNRLSSGCRSHPAPRLQARLGARHRTQRKLAPISPSRSPIVLAPRHLSGIIGTALSTLSSAGSRSGDAAMGSSDQRGGPGVSRMLIGPALRQPTLKSHVLGRQTERRG